MDEPARRARRSALSTRTRRRYAEFAAAVAERYGDRVNRYIIWNEPNLGTWLRPQTSCPRSGLHARSRRTCTARSSAPPTPRSTPRDPGAQVLIGTMSSRGGRRCISENSTHRPLAFLRALGCVNASYKPIRTGRCKGFKPAPGDGFAFHPHGVLTAPDRAFPNPDDVNLASLPQARERARQAPARAAR